MIYISAPTAIRECSGDIDLRLGGFYDVYNVLIPRQPKKKVREQAHSSHKELALGCAYNTILDGLSAGLAARPHLRKGPYWNLSLIHI
eukprot:2637592-Amphidinium_carterae.2